MKNIIRQLKPTKLKLILFVIFMAIVVGGYIQTYAFTDGEEYGLPKPPLYDILSLLPLWPLWMLLTIPLSLVDQLLSLIGLGILSNVYLLFLGNIIYFYLLSALIESLVKTQRTTSELNKRDANS